MAFNFYYHEIIKRTSSAFGTIFNDIYIRHKDEEDEDYSYIKVPLAYGPIQKFLARIEQKPDLRNRVAITLPRMSFQMGKLSYDPSRKVSSTQMFKGTVGTNTKLNSIFLPIPYDLPFDLSIATKNEDDMCQIIEQIIPIFKPEYNLSVNLTSSIGDVKDIPIVLNDISAFSDNYEGNFDTRRFIECTLAFNAKIMFYGPIPSNSSQKQIERVQVDYFSDKKTSNDSRQIRYVATPKAIKDYNNDKTTVLVQNITQLTTEFLVSDATAFVAKSYIQINNEVMQIESISNNTIKVYRGQYKTAIKTHNNGDVINVINFEDDALILGTDEYDFNEETFNFADGKVYSPRKNEDV